MKTLPIALAALIAAMPASAQGPVSVPAFDQVELRGGGEVTIRHGPTQSVTIVRGSSEISGFTVDDDGRLEIRACVRRCTDYDLEVEIVTPDLEALAIRGGGSIIASGSFPEREDLAVAVSGGGSIDVRAIPAGDVAAAVNGGGLIRTFARANLAASINGGGLVRYRGDPETAVSIHGGGDVRPDSGR
jgi:hypothetical protein